MPSDTGRNTRSSAEEENMVQRVVEKILNSPTLLDHLLCKIKDMFKAEMDSLKQTISHLEEQIKVVKKEAFEYKDELEQYSRLNSLRIFGVPEKPGECTDQVVKDLCKEKLNINISTSDIDCSHRLPGKEPYHKPIIVKFVTRNIKKLVYSKKSSLKGSGVVIKEDLTKHRAQLLSKVAKKYGAKHVWSYDGKILVKIGNQIKRIFSSDELN